MASHSNTRKGLAEPEVASTSSSSSSSVAPGAGCGKLGLSRSMAMVGIGKGGISRAMAMAGVGKGGLKRNSPEPEPEAAPDRDVDAEFEEMEDAPDEEPEPPRKLLAIKGKRSPVAPAAPSAASKGASKGGDGNLSAAASIAKSLRRLEARQADDDDLFRAAEELYKRHLSIFEGTSAIYHATKKARTDEREALMAAYAPKAAAPKAASPKVAPKGAVVNLDEEAEEEGEEADDEGDGKPKEKGARRKIKRAPYTADHPGMLRCKPELAWILAEDGLTAAAVNRLVKNIAEDPVYNLKNLHEHAEKRVRKDKEGKVHEGQFLPPVPRYLQRLEVNRWSAVVERINKHMADDPYADVRRKCAQLMVHVHQRILSEARRYSCVAQASMTQMDNAREGFESSAQKHRDEVADLRKTIEAEVASLRGLAPGLPGGILFD